MFNDTLLADTPPQLLSFVSIIGRAQSCPIAVW
ncbi:hypothetical protein BB2000_0639 [Proteus mirabilis BB2000]|nr:hypothetical protein BB2000_0639 [Proteus mirabilis BB2000]